VDRTSRASAKAKLKKLEQRRTDESRLVPHSASWRAYWTAEITKIWTGRCTPGIRVPIGAYRLLADEVAAAHPLVADTQ